MSVNWQLYEGFIPLAEVLFGPALMVVVYRAVRLAVTRPCSICAENGHWRSFRGYMITEPCPGGGRELRWFP